MFAAARADPVPIFDVSLSDAPAENSVAVRSSGCLLFSYFVADRKEPCQVVFFKHKFKVQQRNSRRTNTTTLERIRLASGATLQHRMKFLYTELKLVAHPFQRCDLQLYYNESQAPLRISCGSPAVRDTILMLARHRYAPSRHGTPALPEVKRL
jgi:hypothetical protein